LCYAPVVKSRARLDKALQRISEGKLQEAENLLRAAKLHLEATQGIKIDGRSMASYYYEAVHQLVEAKKASGLGGGVVPNGMLDSL
jgi:hypothetical protein